MSAVSQQTPVAPRWSQNLFMGFTGLTLGGIVLQGFFIGAFLFGGADWGLKAHGFTGLALLIVSLALALTGLAAQTSSRMKIMGFVLFALFLIQMFLPSFSGSAPLVAALHPANAMILFGMSMYLNTQMRQAIRAQR
jgi:hypothetical protein